MATSGGPHERALGSQGISWCLHPGRTLAPSPLVPGYLPDQHGSQWHCWGTLGRCLPGGLSARWILWFLQHRTIGIYLPTAARNGLQGCVLQYENATGPVLEGLCMLLISWTCRAAMCPWGPSPPHSGNTTSLTMRPWSDASWDRTHPHTSTYIQWQWPRVLSRPPVHTQGNTAD